MAPVYTLDPDHFFLGSGCEKKHYWPGTEKSPRRAINRQCVGCYGNRQASDWILRFVDHVASGIPDGCFLGKLCEKGHKWEGFAVSLKWRCSGGAPGYSRCIQCDLESAVEMPKIKQAAKKRPFNKVDRYCDENINILKELIAYDKTHDTGLVWIKSTDFRQPAGSTAGFMKADGSTVFWYAGTYLSAPKIILLLNNVLPKKQDANAACAIRINIENGWSDISNLRWGTRSEALRLACDTRRLELIRSVLGNDGPDLGDRLRLNAPCPKGHLWNGHQLGLQVKQGKPWRCAECCKNRNPEDQEKRKKRNKKRYQENIEEERRKARERMKLLKQADPAYADKCRLYARRRKAMLRGNTIAMVTPAQIRMRFAEFDYRCAFCDIDLMSLPKKKRTIEHVVPIIKGGPHSLGNILPACHACNSSKTDNDVETWYRSQPFFSELRWRKICRVLGWQRSSVGQLALL